MSKLLEAYDNITNVMTPEIKSNNRMIQKEINANIGKPLIRRSIIVKNSDVFREACSKHILLDIYSKILPVYQEDLNNNNQFVYDDIDAFLNNKNQSATQYMKNAYERNHAPLLEYMINSINAITNEYIREADEEDKKNNDDINIDPEPIDDVSEEELDSQLVDIKKDVEYDDFIDKLKKKTIKRIVDDITNLLKDKQGEDNMKFELPQNESSEFLIALNHINEYCMKNNIDADDDSRIMLAVREATLNMIDKTFDYPQCSGRQYYAKIRSGNGIIVNESYMGEYFSEGVLSSAVRGVEFLVKKIIQLISKLLKMDKISKADREADDAMWNQLKNKFNDKLIDPSKLMDAIKKAEREAAKSSKKEGGSK